MTGAQEAGGCALTGTADSFYIC